jgi:DNA-binding IscR family transcriptional regulator
LAAIVSALEGPIALTLCTVDARHDCGYEPRCPVRRHIQKINRAIRKALEDIPLSEMSAPANDELAASLDDRAAAVVTRNAASR